MDRLEKRLDRIFRRKPTLILALLLFLGLCAVGGWYEGSADQDSGTEQAID